MNRYFDLFQQILELLDAIGEGLNYIKLRIESGDYEAVVSMLYEVTQAYLAIETALIPLNSKLASDNQQKLSSYFRTALADITKAYENANWEQVQAVFDNQLLTSFSGWKSELECCLNRYIAC